MKLPLTRAIVDAIHSGQLAKVRMVADAVFGIGVVAECPGVPRDVLIPRDTWAEKGAYDATAHKLANLFANNFRQYEDKVAKEVKEAGPRVKG
jgi:phosphoenolpyruvate carboxykinase (ATP)